jgi:hypothetical protein
MKRLFGWALLCWRLHASLRAARIAIGEAGRQPIRIRPAVRLPRFQGAHMPEAFIEQVNGGLSKRTHA